MATDALKVSGRLKLSTINNFVSRVHGNYLASQRPTLFQGWMGQTVGLFQTYQFNLMQSLFNNVSKGNRVGVAKMMTMQGAIFGAQSVPGFQVLNDYVGKHSADDNDFYSLASGTLGEDASNWLMYGTASSAMVPILGDGIDLYSRGDLTPRTPILLPTSPAEVPAVSITANFFGSILNAVEKMSDGAPAIPTMLDALGHNGFNRPLQGIAQLISGERTTGNGNLIATYRGWDAWNGITKVLGTKTLSEGVAASSFYRTASYRAFRSEQIDDLGEAYRQTVRAGEYDNEVYQDFASNYVSRGGDIENFTQWVMRNNKNSNESQINQLRRSNNSPEGRYMQTVMGADIQDYTTDAGFSFGGQADQE